jgi:hypothetical protein
MNKELERLRSRARHNEKYRIVQDSIFISDYDRYVERLLEMEKKK